LLISQYKYRYR